MLVLICILQGRTYYYHRVTRQTQWEIPTGDEVIVGSQTDSAVTPTHHSSKKSKSKHKVSQHLYKNM